MLRNNEWLWTEKYRPLKVAECILPDRLKKPFQAIVDSKQIMNMMLTGKSGTGKTSVAIAMCEEVGTNYLLINSSDERGIDVVRSKIVGYAGTKTIEGSQKVIILDEADSITDDAQDALRGTIEKFSNNCTFIFTCNYPSKLMDAIHSRCVQVEFSFNREERPLLAALFYRKLEQILKTEGVGYDKLVLQKLVEKNFPDFRRTINELQHLCRGGELSSSALADIIGVKTLQELVGFLKTKNYNSIREWVTNNSDVETRRIFRAIYDSLNRFLKPESVPQAIVILGKYQFQAAFVSDQEINLDACLVELMFDCEFR